MTNTNASALRLAVSALLLTVLAVPAYAWEDDAQRVITETAVKILRQKYSEVFKSGGTTDYYRDVLRGAEDGKEALRGSELFGNERLAMERVGSEIQVLRHMNRRGTPAYFAYRMGVLSALVSDIVLPYGLADKGEAARIRAEMELDIAQHIRDYSFPPRRNPFQLVREPKSYFSDYLGFHKEAVTLIRADYTAGTGYDSFMVNAGPKFFSNAVNATLDVWHSVLHRQKGNFDIEPSPEQRTWYLVDEIDYQLTVKKRSREANHAYTYFSAVNPGIMEAYEAVGDVFYEAGETAQGVREWEYALQHTGPTRGDIITKLSEHHLTIGREALQLAQDDVEKRDNALGAAKRAFEKALQYKRGSREAVELITQTNNTIREREERRALTLEFMAAADKIIADAEKALSEENWDLAILTYTDAIDQLSRVENDFPEQFEIAQDKSDSVKSEIRSIQNDLINKAINALADGNNARDQREWSAAADAYNRIPVLLSPITDEEGPRARDKLDLLQKAEQALKDLEIEKNRAAPAGAAGAPAGAAPPAGNRPKLQ